jgi:hypothetical protein
MHKARCDEPADAPEYAGKNFLEIASSRWTDKNQSAFLQKSHNLMVLCALRWLFADIFMASLAIVQWPPDQVAHPELAVSAKLLDELHPEVHTIALSIAMDKFREAL